MSMTQAEEMVKLEIRKGPDAEIQVGGLRLIACRREVGEIDGGITLYVWGEMAQSGEAHELLRFDFFRNKPHYHAPAEKQEETAISAANRTSTDWGIEALTTRASALVAEAGLSGTTKALDSAALAGAGTHIQDLFDRLEEPNEVSYFEIPASVFETLNA